MPNQSPSDRNKNGGDVTKATKVPTPPVTQTKNDLLNQHAADK